VFEQSAHLAVEQREALDADGLELFRKRVTPDVNMRALETVREIGLTVAINLIASSIGSQRRPSGASEAQ
jgi:magnesium-protoporphyrin IX monomethyl ester (oxidative) cyclase